MKRRPEAGFTIIETLIVLGVAGLIFLIIFLALPALIRNGHNNQRKQDTANILAGISHYQLNHSGDFVASYPSLIDPVDGVGPIKLTIYDAPNISIHPVAAGTFTPITSVVLTPNVDKVDIYNHYLCNQDIKGATNVGAGYRDIVALYGIETASGVDLQCQQL